MAPYHTIRIIVPTTTRYHTILVPTTIPYRMKMSARKSYSQDRRKATRMEQEEAAQEAQAQAAFDMVQSWTSPRLADAKAITTSPFPYEPKPEEYTKRKLMQLMETDQDETMEEVDQELTVRQTPAKPRVNNNKKLLFTTPRVLHRADTPVMSNSSKKTTQTKSPSVNVKSPFLPRAYTLDDDSPTKNTLNVTAHQTPLSRPFVEECRLYHDSLRRFRLAKRRLLDVLERAGNVDEARVDQDFLISLQHACYARAKLPTTNDPLSLNPMEQPARKEGNFWALLSSFRLIGMDALVYAAKDSRDDVRKFLNSLALRSDDTPHNLLETLVGTNAPLSIQRWNAFIKWLERCHDCLLPNDIARPRPSGTTNLRLVEQCLDTTDRELDVTRAALNLLLAGRLEDAIEMAAASRIEFLAAQWSGGFPAGKDGDKTMGNPRRALWQVLMWKKAVTEDKKLSKENLAMAALLSNNTAAALQNPLLRTWERALYTFAKAVLGRLQDDLLHQHNEYRRELRPPYPGTEWAEFEKQHLNATMQVQDMQEADIVREINATPFEEMLVEDPYSSAMAAFWMGEPFVKAHMDDWYKSCQENDDEYLRFLTHLALYLDSLKEGSHRVDLTAVSDWRNGLIREYLNFLASREELWHLMVLYASFLPRDEVLSRLPTLLAPINSQPARKELLGQMSEFLEENLDRQIILKISEEILEDNEIDLSGDATESSAMDARKMGVVSWFSLREDLYLDGLVYANKLLRRFLLDNKVEQAIHFMMEVRPQQIIEYFEAASTEVGATPMVIGDQSDFQNPKETCREHAAFVAFVQTRLSVAKWEGVLKRVQAEPEDDVGRVDETKWTEAEASIAAHEKRRKLVDSKKEMSHTLALAANNALGQLDMVLRFEGGFLLDEEVGDQGGERLDELKRLRSHIIPLVVREYQDICMKMASWMSVSLYDGVKRLGKVAARVVSDLDRSVAKPEDSVFAPSFWSQRALGIMDAVTSETYDCLPVLTAEDRQDLLSLMAGNMVAHLKYRSELA